MIQNHLTSQPLSKRLKELGVPQKSHFYHWNDVATDEYYGIKDFRSIEMDNTSAFLSSELGELLPERMGLEGYKLEHWKNDSYNYGVKLIERSRYELPVIAFIEKNEAECRGLMLEYLILNGLIKI